MISIIIPVYHEQDELPKALEALRSLARQDLLREVLVTAPDGDNYEIPVTHVPKAGRAVQMNMGAQAATGDILLFLHADTRLPHDALLLVTQARRGAFSLCFDTDSLPLRFVGEAATWRSRVTRVPYGDQAFFMERREFEACGGFKDVPLLEDVLLAKKLRLPVLQARVTTSARRYLLNGVLKTVVHNRLIMLGFTLGLSPHTLAQWLKR